MRALGIALLVLLLTGAGSAQDIVDTSGADGVQYPVGPTSRPRNTPTVRSPATPTPGPCACDQDGDGAVSIAELVAGVNAAALGCR